MSLNVQRFTDNVAIKQCTSGEGCFQTDFLQFTTDGTTGWNTFTKNWPIELSVLAVDFQTDSSYETGDLATCYVNIGDSTTPLGNITQDVASGDGSTVGKEIVTTAAVISNLKLNHHLYIDDGTNMECLGRITSIDIANNKFLCETATTYSYAVSTPTALYTRKYYVVDNFPLEPNRQYDFGGHTLNSSGLSAGKDLVVKIKSNSATVKKGVLKIDILY